MFLLNYSHYSILLCLVLNFPFIYSNEGFIYNYFENGNDWEYHCAEGYRQSPIDITDKIVRNCDRISLNLYLNTSENEIRFGLPKTHFHSNLISGTLALIEATDILGRKQFYELKESKSIHFHTPGEHLINGHQPDLSMHMVFLQKGKITHEDRHSVIEITFVKRAEEFSSDLAGDVFLNLLNIKKDHNYVAFSFADLFKDVIAKPDFYHYKGSLTTPPCTEVVSWFVYKHPLEISRSSIDFLEEAWINDDNFSNGRGNYRFPQYLNGRKVFAVSANIVDNLDELSKKFSNSEKIYFGLMVFILCFIIMK